MIDPVVGDDDDEVGKVIDTPRVNAFMERLPVIPLNMGPIVAAQAMLEYGRMWQEFARELERELAKKVWLQ